MALFKKEGDFLDITELQRRGLINKQKIESTSDYADLSIAQKQPVQEDSQDPLGFLSTFAQATADSSPQQTPSLPKPSSHDPTEIADIKVKLEDFEYKLERFMEKIVLIEARLEEFENKGL